MHTENETHALRLPRLHQGVRLLSPSPPDDVQFFQIELQGRPIDPIHLGRLSGANALLQDRFQGHFNRV